MHHPPSAKVDPMFINPSLFIGVFPSKSGLISHQRQGKAPPQYEQVDYLLLNRFSNPEFLIRHPFWSVHATRKGQAEEARLDLVVQRPWNRPVLTSLLDIFPLLK